MEEEPDGRPWYYDIKRYLESGIYPEEASNNQKKTIRRLAKNYFPSGEILFRRTPDLGFLRCVDAAEANKLINEVHIGVCGPHMNGFVLARKILRTGYFWMTMENNCSKYVQKFPKSKIHGDSVQMPPYDLYAMSSPWPFVAWGMDVIGQIEPPASNGHRFILVAIDYFTKWVETSSYRVVTKKVVADFIRNNLICRFRVLELIITNNGANFNSHLMNEICEQFKIAHRNLTSYQPQMNEVVEVYNKKIKKILTEMVENDKSWHEILPYALLGYRPMIKTLIE